jgi:hypothetical protein
MLASNSSLGMNYVIITDSTFAPKVEAIATSILKERKCLGAACAPITNWRIDMNLYGYEKALGDEKTAAIAFASSAWNFIARQAHAETVIYKSKHNL